MAAVNKQIILAQIKKTAAENGGVPLGVLRFENATGIKQTEWLGRYWARWSDAVREAGLALATQFTKPYRVETSAGLDLSNGVGFALGR